MYTGLLNHQSNLKNLLLFNHFQKGEGSIFDDMFFSLFCLHSCCYQSWCLYSLGFV